MVNFTECIEDIRTNHGFKHNSHDDSFYRTYQVEGGKFLQLRVSNHGTYLCTWIEKDYDPSLALSNISIVFTEDGKCESNTAVDMGDKKRSYKVIQYIYNCAVLDNNDIIRINNRMYDIITNRGYIDPLSDNETKKAKVYTLEPNQEPKIIIQENNKQINTNKTVMKISEKQLKKIIKESVKKALKEGQERTPVFGLNAVDLTTDEGFDDMQYTAKVYYSEEEAIEAAKDMARAYSDWDNVINISVMAGEYELPSGDVYGEPYDIYTVSNKDDETTRSAREKRGYVRHDVDEYPNLNESKLRKIIKESVKKALKEEISNDYYESLKQVLAKSFSNLNDNEKIFLYDLLNEQTWEVVYAALSILKP